MRLRTIVENQFDDEDAAFYNSISSNRLDSAPKLIYADNREDRGLPYHRGIRSLAEKGKHPIAIRFQQNMSVTNPGSVSQVYYGFVSENTEHAKHFGFSALSSKEINLLFRNTDCIKNVDNLPDFPGMKFSMTGYGLVHAGTNTNNNNNLPRYIYIHLCPVVVGDDSLTYNRVVVGGVEQKFADSDSDSDSDSDNNTQEHHSRIFSSLGAAEYPCVVYASMRDAIEAYGLLFDLSEHVTLTRVGRLDAEIGPNSVTSRGKSITLFQDNIDALWLGDSSFDKSANEHGGFVYYVCGDRSAKAIGMRSGSEVYHDIKSGVWYRRLTGSEMGRSKGSGGANKTYRGRLIIPVSKITDREIIKILDGATTRR